MSIWIDYPYAKAAASDLGLALNRIDGITLTGISLTLQGPSGTTSINLRRTTDWTWTELLPTILSVIQKNLEITTTMKKVAKMPEYS